VKLLCLRLVRRPHLAFAFAAEAALAELPLVRPAVRLLARPGR
jgi:hypothetical protein